MNSYLVTGAAGFIGSNVAELLLAEGHEVVGLDNLNDAYDVRLKGWPLRQMEGRPRFPGLSLVIVRLMGAREYVVERPTGERKIGRFGPAVIDEAHSTAPNRRFPDLKTQGLLKTAMVNDPAPYDGAEPEAQAARRTEKEDDADKVKRPVRKFIAALLLESRIAERLDTIKTGVSENGNWIRF